MTTRIVRHPFGYRIVEDVTPEGHYIEWPGLFETRFAAQIEIDRIETKKED